MSKENDEDERLTWIHHNLCALSGTSLDQSIDNNLYNKKNKNIINIFFNDLSCNILSIHCQGNNENLTKLICKISLDDMNDDIDEDDVWDDNKSLCNINFIKLKPVTIDNINIKKVIQVTSYIGSSPIDSLYHSLHTLYAPQLLGNKIWSEKLTNNIQNLLSELDQGLGSTIKSSSYYDDDDNKDDDPLESYSNIILPSDEFNFWDSPSRDIDRNLANTVSKSFDMIRDGFNDLEENNIIEFNDLHELIDSCTTCFDEIWNAKGSGIRNNVYPQKRMSHIFDIFGNSICRFLQKKLSKYNLWYDDFNQITILLNESAEILEKWCNNIVIQSCEYWKSLHEHQWIDNVHEDKLSKNLSKRIEQILSIRTTHEELLRLLSREEREKFGKSENFFSPFLKLKPLHYNHYIQPQWDSAMKEFEKSLEPIEELIAANIRQNLNNIIDRPFLMLKEMERYINLLKRNGIRNALSSERETLLSQLLDYLDQLDRNLDKQDFSISTSNKKSISLPIAKNLSPCVNGIVWLKQLNSRIISTQKISKHILKGLSNYNNLKSTSDTIINKIRREEKDLFRKWERDVDDMLANNELSSQMSGKLMEINNDGILVVNFSERLVTLLREVRQLSEFKFKISKDIIDITKEGEKFYRYGIMLKKVANFYNTMGNQIIEKQKTMLLDSLLAFENIIQSTGNNNNNNNNNKLNNTLITWNNPSECENYVLRLQQAADKLSNENRKLRNIHEKLSEEISNLMLIDLLRQREQWRSKYQSLNKIILILQAKYTKKRMSKWILHWDHQLYKALEAGYQMGLESLNENLPEIKVELILSHRSIQFRPPIEEIRAHYYREMKKFISIPYNFEGFGNSLIFRNLPTNNSDSLLRVYQKAEELFHRLNELTNKYTSWIVLSLIDMDEYVEANVNDSSEFLANFNMLKTKRKESDKIPDFEKIDCMKVSLIPFKSMLEDMFQRMNDTLLIILRKNILTKFREIDEYIDNGMELLSERPNTIEGISQAKKTWKDIDDKRENMKKMSNECINKKKILLQYSPGSKIDTSEVVSKLSNIDGEGGRWDTFELALSNFNDMIEEQREGLKSVIEEEVMNLNKSVENFNSRWQALKPSEMKSWEEDEIERVFESLDDWKIQFNELKNKSDLLIENCHSFNMPIPHFDNIETLESDLNKTMNSWDLLRNYQNELNELGKQDWISFRSNIFALQDLGTKWMEKVKEIYTTGEHDMVTIYLQENLENIKKAMPALKYCRGDPFKEEHWSSLLQGKLNLDRSIRLENLCVHHFLSRIEILCEPSLLQFVKLLQARAQGEVTIREALSELHAWSQTAELNLMEHFENGRNTPLIKDWKDLFLELGDKQSLLASLKESQFFKAFEDQGLAYEVKLINLDNYLHLLNSIQRKWVYLEPIFGRGALPSEQSRFRRIDDDFRDIMSRIEMDNKLFNLADESLFPRIKNTLPTMLDQLERCQKALADFLEEKRSAMPRFYFIGDDDLLEILGQATNPLVIQSHLKKLFQGINKVKFNDDHTQIISMISSQNEIVNLERPVNITNNVEDWLQDLASEMRETLRILMVNCLEENEMNFEKYPSQILCITEFIKFTKNCEKAIRKQSINELKKSLQDLLNQYTSYDLSSEPLIQLKIKALVLDLVHNMDVCDQLLEKNISSLNSWQWQKQLRYYIKNGKVIMKMSESEFNYSYEYQGNASKLVHTPLTDKCYLTLTSGMHMGFGGNPYGPAGTGKTESVKALGNAFGRQVLVFNCDEGIDFHSMGRIFTGLVKCGAWGCFDEFNRLKEDQLSAVSQQIQVIQDGIKNRRPTIKLLDKSIDIDFNAGIFVTLNPAGKDYGGRSKLPDNLKALFRPVAMSRPDNELIAEVILYSEGFINAKDLASKIVSLYTLSKQLLSYQRHYDWGLRALKAVLNTGGKLNQSYKKRGEKVTPEIEKEILIKALRVNTLSKLTYNDTKKFLLLINDMFPGVKSSDISGGELEEAIREIMIEKPFNLIIDEPQIKKMLQLKESLDQRMGCVIVGPSGCGKSTVWRILQAALIKCGQAVNTYVMNPKSMPRPRLLGNMDLDTREWTDGVLTDAARKVVMEPQEVNSWVICDGDVDPEWIESLNSVLDDNHLLTLPSGERISFGSNVNFIFETHDLSFASPATVSRMGMIYLSDDDVDLHRIVKKWLRMQSDLMQTSLESWIEEYFFRALDFVLNMEQIVETTMVGTVLNGLSQLKDVSSLNEFICGIIRGLGGNLSLNDRAIFAKELYNWSGERPPDPTNPLDCYADGNMYISYTTIRDTYNSSDSKLNKDDLDEGAVIQTISVQRTISMIQPWVDNMEPFILVGPEGCGKNMIINHIFKRKRNINITTLHCNAQTTAEEVITKIASSCNLFSASEGRVYRPRECERLVLYIKDINLPRPDEYNTCMLIAFLQQLITFGGFYDENLEFLYLENIQIVASMNAASTVGRHPLSTRFTATVRIGVVDYPEKNELITIYDTFLEAVFNTVEDKIDSQWKSSSDRERLSETMIEIYESVKKKFSVDEYRHYLYTPRDLTELTKGLLRYDLENENLLDIIAYESSRIFRDRLVNSDSSSKFDTILNGILRTQWRHNPDINDIYYTSLDDTSNSKEDDNIDTRLTRLTKKDFLQIVKQGLMYYEREEKELNLFLFDEVLDNIAHVDRILSRDSGHLLLIGSSGVGRTTATALTSYMHRYEFRTPAITRGYELKHFYADIKNLMQIAGVDGEHVTFYIEDYQITENAIIEGVNSLLSSGEISGLFTRDELEPLLAPLKEIILEEGIQKSAYEYFISRVQKNLHIVISMDSNHSDFLVRCESNPALYTVCEILWLGQWSRKSMHQVPLMMPEVRKLLYNEYNNESKSNSKYNDDDDDDNDYKNNYKSSKYDDDDDDEVNILIDQIISIHNSCIERGATPRDYMAFLRHWAILYKDAYHNLKTEYNHLSAGLNKLNDASLTVDELSKEAEIQQKELKEAQIAADRAMDSITNALSEATERRNEVQDLRADLAENEKETSSRKADIEEELASINPILEAAKDAVGGIGRNDLGEVRSMSMPPEAVADVLSAVLTLLGIEDTSWMSMRRFLGGRGVIEEILNFEASSITPSIRKSVAKILKNKAHSFEEAVISRASLAAAPLAAWVKANIRYSIVLEKIQPLTDQLAEAEAALERSQERLQQCEDELNEIDDRVAKMKDEFARRTREAEKLRNGLEKVEETLEKAQTLLSKLSGEQDRWQKQAGDLQDEMNTLSLKILMSAGFVIYLAKTPENIREETLKLWENILNLNDNDNIETFSFTKLLTTESELLIWKSEGLPSDSLSQENALVLTKSHSIVPFIIDPANASTSWLKSYLQKDKLRPLEVILSGDQRFTSQVELSVRFGKSLIILDVDTLEPLLFPLVKKDLINQGSRKVVKIGDKLVDYNENFQLFLVTRNPDPKLTPDASSLVNEINFTVTKSGLEGQLLGVTIQHEQPELEKARSEMLKKEEDFKVQLAGLEKDLLEELANAEGNILENTTLIESLTKTKIAAAEIQEALEKSADASEELDRQRNVYKDFAKSGSTLYFLISELKAINPMYKFSLASFIELFKASLKEDFGDIDIKERLRLLTPSLERRVLYFIGRSLFKSDRPMLALHLLHGMHPDIFGETEWKIFTGELVATNTNINDYPEWISPDRLPFYFTLNEFLSRIVVDLDLNNYKKWKKFSISAECEKDFPKLRGITSFHKVLIIQALRPDRLLSAIDICVTDALQVNTINPPPISLDDLYINETTSNVPTLLITTAGADPSKELEEFAERTVGRDRYQELAMGGGQQATAIALLHNAADSGDWLTLKNLHLVVAWLPELEKVLSSLNPHKDFRLWLTTEPHTHFPNILLQTSLKITFESPPGIKKNLLRTYTSWGSEYIEKGSKMRAQLLYILAWFHGIVQERRNFVPQGWSKYYEFSLGDLRAGSYVMESAAEKGEKNDDGPDWITVNGLMEDAIYGGRVDNPFDIRVMRSYLKTYFNNSTIGLRNNNKSSNSKYDDDDNNDEQLIVESLLKELDVPNSNRFDEFMGKINGLPDTDQPYIFGLPENIERSVQRAISTSIINQLRKLSIASADNKKFDRELWRKNIGPIIDIWDKLKESNPQMTKQAFLKKQMSRGRHIDNEEKTSSKKEDDDDDESIISSFINMENKLASLLCGVIDKDLSEIKKVIYGTGLLTSNIQTIASSLLKSQIPSKWEKLYEGAELPQQYLKELVKKRIALLRWSTQVIRNTLLDNPLDLSELFNPGTFLNALRQETARKIGVSIDSLKLKSSWNTMSNAALPISLNGLSLQGAVFNGSLLNEPEANGSEIVQVSGLNLAYVPIDEAKEKSRTKLISIPLYFSITREKLLVEINMPKDESIGKYILAGCGLFLSAD